MQASAWPRRRRRLSKLVTTETVEEEWRLKGAWLTHLEDFLPPTDAEDERARRSSIRNEVAKHVFMGACMVLREYHPSHYRTLMTAGALFGIEKLSRGEARFRIRRLPRDAFMAVHLAVLHGVLSTRLRAVWSKEPTVDSVRVPRFVSKKGKYGAAQYHGSRRKHAVEQMRVAEIQAVVREWQAEIVDPICVAREFKKKASLPRRLIEPLAASMARRLVRGSKGPVGLSYAVLAYLLGVAKDTVKARVIAVTKNKAKWAEIDLVLRARGYTPASEPGQ